MIDGEITNQIIEYIRANRVSTTEVADCLGKTGVIPCVYPVTKGLHKVGKIKWVYAYNESNWDVHEQIRDAKSGEIVYIEAFDCADRAVVGELVTKFLILYRQAEALVTNANMRDAHKLIKEQYPVWCSGFSPIGCYNTKNEISFREAISSERIHDYTDNIMVCDDSGVVVIPKEQINKDFYHKLEGIEEQEDIWFDCIDRKKWDTFDTVCLKKYLEV